LSGHGSPVSRAWRGCGEAVAIADERVGWSAGGPMGVVDHGAVVGFGPSAVVAQVTSRQDGSRPKAATSSVAHGQPSARRSVVRRVERTTTPAV